MRIAMAVMVVIAMSVGAAGATSLFDARPVAGDSAPEEAPGARAVVDSFPSPGTKPMGLVWAEPGLFHVDEAKGDVYWMAPDGAVVLLFNVLERIGHPESQDCGNGICEFNEYMAGQLYITDFNGHKDDPETDRVYHFCTDGTLVSSWDVSAIADGVVGIATRYGSTFWLTTAGGEVVECNDDFEETARYSIPGYSGGGIDYDTETHKLYLIDYVTGDVLVCDDEMNVLTVFDGHPTATNMIGVTVGSTARESERSVWTSTYGSVDPPVAPSIFEIDDEYYDPNPVEASSWGAIKGIYR